MGRIVLGRNQYGKAECHVVRVSRDTPRHRIEDLLVTTQLRGDFEACHVAGDNSLVIATDTQKNTVNAFAREGIDSPESFLLRLADHFVDGFEQVSGAEMSAVAHAWERIGDHDHAFRRDDRGTRTARVEREGARTTVTAGLDGCTILKSTDSEFRGFPRDRYTTLQDTDDRVLATSLSASWTYAGLDHDWDALHADITDLLLTTFADHHSLALQQTVFAMGSAVLERHEAVVDISLSCPNKHHILVDLTPFGLDNPGEVFHATDRPYGLISATVRRED